MTIQEIIEGIGCETCFDERTFGNVPNSKPDNLYIYIDFGGNTRCLCKKHMSYGKNGSPAILDLDDDWDYPAYGAKLISEILNPQAE